MTPVLNAKGFALGVASPKTMWVDRYIAPQNRDGVDYSGVDSGARDAEDMRYYARQTLPPGTDAGKVDFAELDPQHIERFKEKLATGKPLYGATIVHGGCSARFDGILPDPEKGGFKLVGISAVCTVKPEHVDRLAFQTWLLDQVGVKVTSHSFLHLNGDFVKDGQIKAADLIVNADVTALVEKAVTGTPGIPDIPDIPGVRASKGVPAIKAIKGTKGVEAIPSVEETVTKLLSVLANKSRAPVEPETFCPEIDDANLPKHHPHTLTNGRDKKIRAIFELGCTDLAQIPPSIELSPTQIVQVEAIQTGKVQMDRAKLGMFFSKLQYPLQYLDFETMQTAIPMYDGSKPYQQIPFQFSLHTVDSPGAAPRHKEFLSESAEDPRPAFFSALKGSLEKDGTIVCYNSTFETSRLQEGAEQFPEHKEWVEKALPRVEDLLAPFRSFAYYHPEQKGSTSIKAVLPALTGGTYDNMAIGDGKTASRQYMRMVFGDIERSEADAISTNLRAYCGMDTKSLIQVHEIVEGDMMGLRKGREPLAHLAIAPTVRAGEIPGNQPALFEF